jgi:hypothetical protein
MKAPLWECDARGRLPARKAPLPPGVLFTHQASVVLENGQLVIETTGHDSQVGFDAVPPGPGPYTLQLRMKSTGAGLGQVFWVTTPAPNFVAEQNVAFEPIHDGQWHDYTLTLPVKQPAVTFLRLDSGSSPGEIRLERWVLKDATGRVLTRIIHGAGNASRSVRHRNPKRKRGKTLTQPSLTLRVAMRP